MDCFARSHLSDPSVHESAAAHAGGERTSTAHLLADIAEIDERKLYLPAGYPSLLAYCVGELKLCDQAALKRMRAARAAQRFPAILPALAKGRLHLTAVVLLAPHLTEHTAEELLAAATDKSKSEIERLLAARFPKSDVLAWAAPIPAASVASSGPASGAPGGCQLSPGTVQNGTVFAAPPERSSAKPLSSNSFAVQFTMSEDAHDNLRYAQALLGHQVPAGDIAQVIERSLAVYVRHLENTKFAATERPRACRKPCSPDSRHVPAPVRRAVWERDEGRCTFVSETGHRCEADTDLAFDHIEAFARGGEATVSGIRLLCQAHNQFEAERTFGAEFMRHKRIAATEARSEAKGRMAAARATADRAEETSVAEQAHVLEVVPWLRALGLNARESREAAERCRDMREASLEARVRAALAGHLPRGARVVRPRQLVRLDSGFSAAC